MSSSPKLLGEGPKKSYIIERRWLKTISSAWIASYSVSLRWQLINCLRWYRLGCVAYWIVTLYSIFRPSFPNLTTNSNDLNNISLAVYMLLLPSYAQVSCGREMSHCAAWQALRAAPCWSFLLLFQDLLKPGKCVWVESNMYGAQKKNFQPDIKR